MYINVPAKQKPDVTLVITDAYHLRFLVVLFHPLSPYFQSFVPKENTAQTQTHTHTHPTCSTTSTSTEAKVRAASCVSCVQLVAKDAGGD